MGVFWPRNEPQINASKITRGQEMSREKILFIAINLVLIALFLAGCASSNPVNPPAVEEVMPTAELPSGPDLVIHSFNTTEPDWQINGFKTNAEVIVKNVGNMPASSFEVGIVSVNREDNHLTFDFEYDSTLTTELSAGQEVILTGSTGLYWHGHFDITCFPDAYDATQCAMRDENTLWLMAIADYCSEDTGTQYCAVEEIDETNNTNGPEVIERVN